MESSLPKKRTGTFLAWVDRSSVCCLIFCGLLTYLVLVFLGSLVMWGLARTGIDVVANGSTCTSDFWGLVYFNFITTLTVGYGDFAPVGPGKFIAVIESLVGVGLYGAVIALAVSKLLHPPANILAFSDYAYYSEKEQKFLIIYVNTTNRRLSNCSISSYFKLGGDWEVTYAVTAPLLTKAVQTFYIDFEKKENIINNLRSDDSLRVGIAGFLGSSQFSLEREYSAEKILVIPDRNELVEYKGFWKPDFRSEEFSSMFHYNPDNSFPLTKLAKPKAASDPESPPSADAPRS